MKYLITKGLCLTLLLSMLAGCATGPTANPADPLEPINRKTFAFNKSLDETIAKPIATAYKNLTPRWTRTGIGNFFGNLSDFWSTINYLLQGQGIKASHDFSRVLVNSTLGIGGLLDLATELQIQRHSTDFGITLGCWGVPSGPYVVLPILGPSTVRNIITLPLNAEGNLLAYIPYDSETSFSLSLINLINQRSSYLGAENLLDSIALDKYTFMRDAFLQRQNNLIDNKQKSSTRSDNTIPFYQKLEPWASWFKIDLLHLYPIP